jgi:hypothetical protein
MEKAILLFKNYLKDNIDAFNIELGVEMEAHLSNSLNYLEFQLPFTYEELNQISTNPGVYLIQVELESLIRAIQSNRINWKKDFKAFWRDPSINTPIESMPDIHENILNNTNNQEWINLYVGKRLNLKSRLKEHLFRSPHSKTGALKLDKRVDLLTNVKFRLATISFSQGETDMDQIICKIMEDKLRSLRNPILGIK